MNSFSASTAWQYSVSRSLVTADEPPSWPTAPDGAVAKIVFNNPAKHNAVSLDMWEQFTALLQEYAVDDDIRVLVVSGAGGKAFVSGADISKFESERASKEAVEKFLAEAKFSEQNPELWTPLYSMVTFSPDVPYAEALRVGDEQNTVMDKIMALPDIDSNWDEPFVMEQLLELATESFGET